MEMNEYQKRAMTLVCLLAITCPICFSILSARSVNFLQKIAKQIRKGNITIGGKFPISVNHLTITDKGQLEDLDSINIELQKEAGDILWQLSGVCKVMGWKLDDIAQQNLDKLSARKASGTIDGNGDNR